MSVNADPRQRPHSGVAMRTEVRPLRPEDAQRAFAVLHLVDGSCTLSDWLSFIHDIDGPRRDVRVKAGVMVAHGPDKGMLGLFAYKTSIARPMRRLLIVHHFVAFDPFSHGATADALIRAMDDLAGQLSCEAIRLELPHSHLRAPLGDLNILPRPVAVAGYCLAGVNAIKSLAIKNPSE